ncbi:hypothetical protein OC835_005537 [Tilletia horrida]|uniref:Cullin family profile domain-containing protein n=1 Tax=Tilletia horrida TaxID=155126 RepID=A0AAN6GFM2_9BASI|nr:hypothetical protein OC835_005537 [Tilletia horrida]KAK0534560.1 hypothetical protein OC842_002611 [Tilletia horrida]
MVGRNGKLRAPKRAGTEMTNEERWRALAKAISQIQNHNESIISMEEQYRYAHHLVLHREGRALYDGVKNLTQHHLNKLCKERLVPTFPTGGVTSLTDGPAPSSAAANSTSSSSLKGKGVDRSGGLAQDGISGFGAGVSGGAVHLAGADAAAHTRAGDRLLTAMRDMWNDHYRCMKNIAMVLGYLDRTWVPQSDEPGILQLGLELFRDTVIRSKQYPIETYLFSTLLSQIRIEREGNAINRSVLKSSVDMLNALTHPRQGLAITARQTLYRHDFEPKLLSTTAEFYQTESEDLLDRADASSYLKHVERRFQEEEDRVTVYLNSATAPALRHILEQHLLSAHLRNIAGMPDSGLDTMLEEDKIDDLARMYRLFYRVIEGPIVLKSGVKAYIGRKGRAINEAMGGSSSNPGSSATAAPGGVGNDDAAGDMGADDAGAAGSKRAAVPAQGGTASSASASSLAFKWVEDVLALKAKMDRILKEGFGDDKGCEASINEAFETFFNMNPRAPEFISLFLDENLKKGLKGKSEDEVEEVLTQTIVVFRFLHEKDVFERYYKQHLAKRLLQARSVSDDAERGMMAKLKVECGHGYVQKLQGMLNDMKVSEEITKSFQASLDKSGRRLPYDMSVNVLTSTYWPVSAQAPSCQMPPLLMNGRKAFEQFYASRHSGRVLTWHPHFGGADVRVSFKNKKHELNVFTYALVILLLFEDTPDEGEGSRLTYEYIRDTTQIPAIDVQRTLQSLACGKYKILLKEPKGKDINPGDRFCFNINFSAPLARIKIAQVVGKVETPVERKETAEKVEEERKSVTEACIVRIMKNRKTMNHNDLVNEVVRQLSSRFVPSPASIKKRIEALIDREYLERSEAGRAMYNYVA